MFETEFKNIAVAIHNVIVPLWSSLYFIYQNGKNSSGFWHSLSDNLLVWSNINGGIIVITFNQKSGQMSLKKEKSAHRQKKTKCNLLSFCIKGAVYKVYMAIFSKFSKSSQNYFCNIINYITNYHTTGQNNIN